MIKKILSIVIVLMLILQHFQQQFLLPEAISFITMKREYLIKAYIKLYYVNLVKIKMESLLKMRLQV